MTTVTRLVLTLALVLATSLSASAETLSVRFNGLYTYGMIDIYVDGAFFTRDYAGLMKLSIDDTNYPAYCIDMDAYVQASPYEAEVEPAPAGSPWCEVGYVVQNYPVAALDHRAGAVAQLAIWKLLGSASEPVETISAGDASIELDAVTLAEEAEGSCSLSCSQSPALTVTLTEGEGNTVRVAAQLTDGGRPAPGYAVVLTASAGSFEAVQATEGLVDSTRTIVATTDADGMAWAVLDPGTEAFPITVSAVAEGRDLLLVTPVSAPAQAMVATTLAAPCDILGQATYDAEPTPLGDPHTIGYWKHQFAVATGAKGKAQVPAAELAAWLPLGVLGIEVATLTEGKALLWIGNKGATMADRAVQQCLATRLNEVSGELGARTRLDLDGDGTTDGTYAEIWDLVEEAYAAGDYEVAKTLCDDINNL